MKVIPLKIVTVAAVGCLALGLGRTPASHHDPLTGSFHTVHTGEAATFLSGSYGSNQPNRVPTIQSPARPGEFHEFYFTRAIYSDYGRGRFGFGGRRGRWSIDYPEADVNLLFVLTRLVDIEVSDRPNPVNLADPELRRFPFLYALEVGGMAMTDAELEGLRNYLLAGGFLMVDDFWGSREWANFEYEMLRLFPDRPIVDIPLDHPLFDMVYEIEEVVQVPAYGRAGTPYTWEQDGYVPMVKGIFDDEGRLMVVINWNTDLGDAWEWAEDPFYPLDYSRYASEVAVNTIVYAMSH